jgi:uncharacterized protein YkwD
MLRTSRVRQVAVVAVGTVMASLPIADASARPAPTASHIPLHVSADCPDANMVIQPRSKFANTSQGLGQYILHLGKAERAVRCLVNDVRQRQTPSVPPLKWFLPVGRGQSFSGIAGAAKSHAKAAAALRWWGTMAKYQVGGKKCTQFQGDPSRCDPHINPETGSTPVSRIQESGYTKNCKSWSVAENTYTGWGSQPSTPRAAFDYWMGSDKGHRENILNPAFTETHVAVVQGSAQPVDDVGGPPSTYNDAAATYVQVFARCDR